MEAAAKAGLNLTEDPLALVKTSDLLSCLLAGIMLLLSASIVLEALRRWGIMLFGRQEPSAFGDQLSAVSDQQSAVSEEQSAVSGQR